MTLELGERVLQKLLELRVARFRLRHARDLDLEAIAVAGQGEDVRVPEDCWCSALHARETLRDYRTMRRRVRRLARRHNAVVAAGGVVTGARDDGQQDESGESG